MEDTKPKIAESPIQTEHLAPGEVDTLLKKARDGNKTISEAQKSLIGTDEDKDAFIQSVIQRNREKMAPKLLKVQKYLNEIYANSGKNVGSAENWVKKMTELPMESDQFLEILTQAHKQDANQKTSLEKADQTIKALQKENEALKSQSELSHKKTKVDDGQSFKKTWDTPEEKKEPMDFSTRFLKHAFISPDGRLPPNMVPRVASIDDARRRHMTITNF
jgi:hypothetical protein